MCLQLIGACTVWIDMTKTAADFGERPSLRKSWEYFISGFRKPQPLAHPTSIELSGGAFTMTGASARLTVRRNAIEDRVKELENEVAGINKQLDAVRNDITKQKNELRADMQRREVELRRDLDSLRIQLTDAFVGNYAVLRLGALWLVFGIVLSSVAVEITNFFHLHYKLPAFW
jgi:hypothetical protein